jgi:hypothetical protein
MAITELKPEQNEMINNWKKSAEAEIPGCHIEKKGERVLVTIPKTRGEKKVLVFSANEVKKLIQDIYMS